MIHSGSTAPTDHRYRRFGTLRVLDEESESWFVGPGRRFKLSIYVDSDGQARIPCLWCYESGDFQPDGVSSWCGSCGVLTVLDRPFAVQRAA
jgi:hypothetical protein